MWNYPMFPPQKSLTELIQEHEAMGKWLKTLKEEKKDEKKPKGISLQWWEVGIILYALSKPVYLLLDHYHLLPLFQ